MFKEKTAYNCSAL